MYLHKTITNILWIHNCLAQVNFTLVQLNKVNFDILHTMQPIAVVYRVIFEFDVQNCKTFNCNQMQLPHFTIDAYFLQRLSCEPVEDYLFLFRVFAN